MQRNKRKVLVVGTTDDYIQQIRRRMPGRAVFITTPEVALERTGAVPETEELVISLEDTGEVMTALENFQRIHGIQISGVACFDCESLFAASVLAKALGLSFPSPRSVIACCDKYLCKSIWKYHGVPCPEAGIVRRAEDLETFMKVRGNPVILKPLYGSGSEYVFLCRTLDEAVSAYEEMTSRLAGRTRGYIYRLRDRVSSPSVLCEEFMPGPEFSCDAWLGPKDIQLIRFSRKYLLPHGPAGTVEAYEVPGRLPDASGMKTLETYLAAASSALGLGHCIFMADFIWMKDGRPYFLELTPRPGGDCLPLLIKQSCGVDMLELTLDLSEGREPTVPSLNEWEHLVGMRFFACRPGILKSTRVEGNGRKKNMRVIQWLRRPGDRIKLPPEDYNTWLVAQGIFAPEPDVDTPAFIDEIRHVIKVDIAQE